MQQVPNPQSKNFGPGNQNLLSEESSGGSRAANVTISFGQLGSYTYNQPKLIPAPAEQLQPTVQSIPTKETAHVYKLSKDECKEALLKFASQGCCANKKPVEEGHMTDVNSYNALEYVLETYNEKRSLICTFAQCRPGETLNSLGAGQIPDPWSLACQPGATYNNEVRNITLPFTDCIQPCHACNSFGQLRCLGCGGDGRTTCMTCDGSKFTNRPNAEGAMVRVTCSSCGGNGQKTCVRCSGDGRTICNVCQGVQVLKWFLQVRVEYINHVDKYTKEKTDLPDELISTVKGEDLGTNEGRQVPPMADSDSKDVVDNSIRLIQKANQAYGQERRVMQRHRLTCVTCSECALEHNGQTIKFWVYGQERKVYCPEYPGGCCCTIL